MTSEPVAGEVAEGAVGARVEEVGDEDEDAAPATWARAWRQAATRSVTPSAGWIADSSARRRNARPEPRSAARRRPVRPASEAEHHPVLGREGDVAERGRGPLGEDELVRRAVGHRGRPVDEERDREVLLLDEELHEQLLEAGVDVPVELAQVVAERCSRGSRRTRPTGPASTLRRPPLRPPRTGRFTRTARRSRRRRNASSKTVGSTSDGRKASRPPCPRTGRGARVGAPSAPRGGACAALLHRSRAGPATRRPAGRRCRGSSGRSRRR